MAALTTASTASCVMSPTLTTTRPPRKLGKVVESLMGNRSWVLMLPLPPIATTVLGTKTVFSLQACHLYVESSSQIGQFGGEACGASRSS